MEISAVTEIAGAFFATFGIVIGMGVTFCKGYMDGKCLLPSTVIWFVNIPMLIAVLLRAITFTLDGNYWFFILPDMVGFAIITGLVSQHFGQFLKKSFRGEKMKGNRLWTSTDFAIIDTVEELGPINIKGIACHTFCSPEEILPHVEQLVLEKELEVMEIDGEKLYTL